MKRMEFDNLDVEKDFPGLYASGSADTKSRRSKEDSDYSEGDVDKISKKELLIGKLKDKKDKGKDRGYAALEGESSPEGATEAKSPSKSRKAKAFTFTSSKSKEKREKSRDKCEKEQQGKENEPKIKDKEKPEKEKEKKKEKERKDKEKKDKCNSKERDKRDKKSKQTTSAQEEILELGIVQPVFGVSVSLATERSRCHDGIDLPLVVRDCIDYLQEHCLQNEQIYRVEPAKHQLQHLKRLYNNRDNLSKNDELDVSTACGLLKLFLRELPEPILTTDLMARFEDAATYTNEKKQEEVLQELLEQLPKCNKVLLAWILMHFNAVLQNEPTNKMNLESLAMLLSPSLQMSHRLLVTLLCHYSNFFSDYKLIKYVPPITASTPKLPDIPADIQKELCKQESLLSQIHAEMNAGFVSKKREEQLWEVQRIITQLKRKLRSVEKWQEKPTSEGTDKNHIEAISTSLNVTDSVQQTIPTSKLHELSDATEISAQTEIDSANSQDTKGKTIESANSNGIYKDQQSGFLMVPKSKEEYCTLLRLQFENQELLAWKTQLQARINVERAEVLQLKQAHHHQESQLKHSVKNNDNSIDSRNFDVVDGDYERVIEHYIRENTLLEHKRNMLAKDIFDKQYDCIGLQVELLLQKFENNS